MIETLNAWGGQFINFARPMLWQSSLLIAVVLALDFLLARKIRAAVRYALWLVVLVKLLLPPALAFPTGAAWWLVHAKPATPMPIAKKFTVTYDTTPLPVDLPMPDVVMPPAPAPKLSGDGWTLLATAAVSAGLLLWLAVRWWQVARMVRRATIGREFLEPLSEAWRLTGTRSLVPVKLKIVGQQMSPAVCGLFRPTILLSQELAEGLSSEQLRAVLLHELIHLRRKDVWVNCAQALLQIFYWWHPLLWLANARIRRLREEAVDDAVMLALRDEAESYAPTLLEVAKLALRRPLLSLGLVGIMESRSALRQRIERLVDFRAPRKAGLTFFSALGIFAFSAVALPMGEAPQKAAPDERIGGTVSATPAAVTSVSPTPTDRPLVLIQAEIYRMRQTDFEKIVSDPAVVSTRRDEGENFRQFARILKSSSFSPILRPRIQTSSGMPAQFYTGNETNSIEFECRPVVTNELIDLATRITMITAAENETTTNLTTVHTTYENGGGHVFSMRGADDPSGTNLAVVTIDTEIVTNQMRFHERLQSIIKPADGAEADVKDGKLLYEMGNFAAAEARLKAALAADSNNPTARYYLNLVEDAKRSRTSSATNNLNYTGPGRQAIVAKLDHIRLDNVSFDNLPLKEVLKQLAEQIRLRDPEHKGINFLINSDPDVSSQPASPSGAAPQLNPETGLPMAPAAGTEPADVGSFIIKIPSLKDVRLADVLDAIVHAADHPIKYSIEDFAVVFSTKTPQTPPLFSRVFALDSRTFPNSIADAVKQIGHGTNSAESISALAGRFFASLGVDMQSPPGKVVFYNDKLGRLFVKATEADLNIIEQVLEVLNTVPPQIHIKARFFEVPKGMSLDLATSTAMTNRPTEFTGILNWADAKALLHSLQSREGIENLGEPEVTTLSGRQTQMRVTQVITAVTNLTFREVWTNQDGTTVSNAIIPQTSAVETGPILDVVPYVLSDGYTINLALIPSDAEFRGYNKSTNVTVAYNRAGNKYDVPMVLPDFRVRQIATTVNLWDNQTAVIRGFSEQEYVGGKKIPGNTEAGTNELLLFVTATIVDPAGRRVHTDEEMSFAQKGIPAQPAHK